MNSIYCSTGAFIGRANNRDYRLIPSQARKLKCDGLELMWMGDWSLQADAVMGCLKEAGVTAPVLHLDKSITDGLASRDAGEQKEMEKLLRLQCCIAAELGAFMVLHLWHGAQLPEQLDHLIHHAMPRVLDTAGEYGVECTVENIPQVHRSPLAMLEELAGAYTGLRFTLDVRHAAFMQEEEALWQADWLWKGERVRHVHISDFAGPAGEFSALRQILMPGQGIVQMDAWFAFLRGIGYAGSFTLESSSIGPEGLRDAEEVNGALKRIAEGIQAHAG